LHNRKTDNDRQIINKQHAAAEINQLTNQHKKLLIYSFSSLIQLVGWQEGHPACKKISNQQSSKILVWEISADPAITR